MDRSVLQNRDEPGPDASFDILSEFHRLLPPLTAAALAGSIETNSGPNMRSFSLSQHIPHELDSIGRLVEAQGVFRPPLHDLEDIFGRRRPPRGNPRGARPVGPISPILGEGKACFRADDSRRVPALRYRCPWMHYSPKREPARRRARQDRGAQPGARNGVNGPTLTFSAGCRSTSTQSMGAKLRLCQQDFIDETDPIC